MQQGGDVIHLCLGSGVYDENVCLQHLEREGGDVKTILLKNLRGSFMLLCYEGAFRLR